MMLVGVKDISDNAKRFMTGLFDDFAASFSFLLPCCYVSFKQKKKNEEKKILDMSFLKKNYIHLTQLMVNQKECAQ